MSLPIPPAVHASGIGKRFPGVVALDDVSLDFAPGAVTAVLGENGAGKSTLMSILAGLQAPGSGTLEIHGERVSAFTPTNLLTTHGVALVPQEVALARERTVAANVLMGIEPGLLPSRAAMTQRTRELLADVGAEHISPATEVGHLGLADRQLLLIARAVGRRCRILILDEPTTSLTPQEVERLFGLLRRLRDAGTTLLYVSHRLPEIFALSEAIHVLRDGRHVASFRTDEVDTQTVIRAMVGRDLAERENEPRAPSGEPRVVVSRFTGKGFHDVSLELGRGEIVGLAGLPDCGRSELVSALFGDQASTGSLTIDAAPVALRNPRAAIRAGIGFVPVERRSQAIFPDLDVAANLAVLDLADVGRFGLLSRESIRRIGRERIGQFDIRGGAGARITQLSGGNQQKIILARWLSRRPRLLLLDDPTRGVDVGAKLEIHRLLGVAAAAGTSVLLSSSDLPELLFVCDRIVVLAHGRVVGDLTAEEASERRIMALAAGVERELTHVD